MSTPPSLSDPEIPITDEKSVKSLDQGRTKFAGTASDNGLSANAEEPKDGEASRDAEYPNPARLALIIFAVTLCVFLVALDLTIIGTSKPRITDEFHSLEKSVGMVPLSS